MVVFAYTIWQGGGTCRGLRIGVWKVESLQFLLHVFQPVLSTAPPATPPAVPPPRPSQPTHPPARTRG